MSVFSDCLILFTMILVKGSTSASYPDLTDVWKIIILSISSAGRIKEKHSVKNRRESDNSPNRVETIARSEKFLPFEATFILLMMKALQNDPARKARRLAVAILGVLPNTVSNACW